VTSLLDLAPRPFEADAAYTAFAGWAEGRGLPLYPAQDEALIEIVSGANVVLSTPTGTGKSPSPSPRTSPPSPRADGRTTRPPSRRS